MAVTNLVKDQEHDHVFRIAKFAAAAIEAANNTYIDEDDPSQGCVNIRVGYVPEPCFLNPYLVNTSLTNFCPPGFIPALLSLMLLVHATPVIVL